MEPNQAPLQGLQQTNCWFGLINLEISGFPQSSCAGVKFLPRFSCANPSPSLWNGAEPGFRPSSCSQTTLGRLRLDADTSLERFLTLNSPVQEGLVSGGLVTAAVPHVGATRACPTVTPGHHTGATRAAQHGEDFLRSLFYPELNRL